MKMEKLNDNILHKGGSKRRSQVWQHFQITSQGKAKCNGCGSQLHFRGSTFNLKRHLENRHKDIDISQMFKPRNIKPQMKMKQKIESIEKINDVDPTDVDAESEDSFFWAEETEENEEVIEETHNILVTSDHSTAKSDEILNSKRDLHVVSFDFQEFKNDTGSMNSIEKDQNVQDCNIEVLNTMQSSKKKIKKLNDSGISDNDFRETKIFGDFVASQLRILDKQKREKLQILIQRAILDVVCDETC